MIGRFSKKPESLDIKPKGFDDYDLRIGDMMRGERATLGKSLLDVERDLRIKAPYLAGIENADVTAFDAPSFIAGYVRSYARYLGLNPDESFAQFCRETGFVPAHGLSPAASTAAVAAVRAKGEGMGNSGFNPSFATPQRGGFAAMQPGALGSLALLMAVALGLAYGGWSVLQAVQKVQLAPVDQSPAIVANAPAALDPLASAGTAKTALGAGPAPLVQAQEKAASASELGARPSQPQALEVPVLVARDGPISAIDPRKAGVLAEAVANMNADEKVQVVAAAQMVEVLAVRPSWISVTAADGTVLFEKILDAGERYAVPALEVAPRLKAGNSSAVYFVMGDQTFGPASTGPEVVRNVDLSAAAVRAGYTLADASKDADLTSFVAENASAAAPLPAPQE